MGGIGFSELLLLGLIALLVVGPRKLPEVARGVGQLTRTARGAWLSLKSEFQAEIDRDHNHKIMEAGQPPAPTDKPADERPEPRSD
ncbi:MAG: Sec-independent protein translocase protein TatB [Wenzhouxiangella sp.]